MMYINAYIIPTIITIIVLVGIIEKKDVYDLFCSGAKEGITITVKMFPILIGIFLAVGMMKNSGLLEEISKLITPITMKLRIPTEVVPLIVIRPISGSATMALATNIMRQFGGDSSVGRIAAAIMGSSETTFYVIAIYMNAIRAKKSRNVLIPAILADLTSAITAILLLRK